MAGKTDHITIDTTYFHTNQINIHPIHTKADGIRFTHYICTFPDKQSSILILHYTTIESVKCLLRD